MNVCEICDAETSATAWTDNDGARCDDGAFCNGADTCSGGACTVNAGNPCADDGFYCNGDESCNEDDDVCESSGNPCGVGDLCTELVGSFDCCTPGEPATGKYCNDDLNVVQLDACGDEILIEDCLDPAANGGFCHGVCGCAPGWTGETCDQCVIYVATFGDDDNDGTTWESALATVQAGITAATAGGCDVWVANGTYYPTEGTDRTATFQLVAGVTLYGGFYGYESLLEERDWEHIETILSGDLNRDDATGGDDSDNVYHVVTGADDATIDGFTITAGNADGSNPHHRGGGMYNDNASPTVTNCTFTGNSADYGGGMANYSSSSPTVTNCTFTGNSA
ncbi:MAG: hypothetical protein GY842_19910, partial [bacterium]|nr:hypothetical protein [bacterium]